MNLYGLIGFPLTHSFSKKYFTETVFPREHILDSQYELFPIDNISQLESILSKNSLKGLNVTIPYKEKVYEYILNTKDGKIHSSVDGINAVNVIKINKDKTLTGYNSDFFGFKKSLSEFMQNDDGKNLIHSMISNNEKALILGNGGAAKAVIAGLKSEGIQFGIVTRKKENECLHYNEIDEAIIDSHKLIINTTPLGTYPNVNEYPDIPYHFLTKKHFLFDLVYNPPITTFMQKGRDKGAKVINGKKMLEYQAEKAWEIWNS
jgi:shikimate dehydrogenase